MPSSSQSGSQTATISTRHQLGTTITTAGNYVLHVDTANMVNGDALTLEIETIVKASGTSRVTTAAYFDNAQGEPNKRSAPIAVTDSVKFFLTQTAGTGRAFDWNIVAL